MALVCWNQRPLSCESRRHVFPSSDVTLIAKNEPAYEYFFLPQKLANIQNQGVPPFTSMSQLLSPLKNEEIRKYLLTAVLKLDQKHALLEKNVLLKYKFMLSQNM